MKPAGRKKEVTRRVRELAPHANLEDFQAILEHALVGHLRHLPPSIAVWQSITSRARHVHTDYDQLLADGYDADSARHFVLNDINAQLSQWGCTRLLSSDEE